MLFFLLVSFIPAREMVSASSREEAVSEADTASQDDPLISDEDRDETERSEENLPAAEESESLYEKTLKRDIETAGYYELLAWVRSLNLPDQGNIDVLRNQLYTFYEITRSRKASPAGSLIIIKSAKDTDYFTIEEKDHQMIRLKGNVLVEMEEGDSNRKHIISADELIFNQTEKTITAQGNLEYKMISGDYEDLFYGDSLTFSISSWNGVIFKGSSHRKEVVEGVERTFYFNGELIRKSGKGGVFILEDGSVQTQDVNDPDFHLEAQRLWLMGPKEWGIRHGILYIGHVPVLYIPFYYKPGNEMIFNPVIGSRMREGNFIQTTTYLIGRKDASQDLSFFKLGDTNEQNYKLVREGLYLMKINEPPDEKTDDSLKVMGDWYSRLGAFTGIDGEFYNKGILNSIDFTSGIGVSRTISDANNIYYLDESGYVEDWNSTVVGTEEYPFRWGQTLSFKTDSLTGSFQFYSDPYFNQDFRDREESFDWLNTLMTNDMSEEDDPDLITDMDWILSYSHTFTPSFLSPAVNSINLSEVRFQVDWNRKENQSDSLIYDNDPAREFFYPESVSLPYAKISIGGTPLSYSTAEGWGWKKNETRTELIDGEDDLIPPWASDDAPDEEEEVRDEEKLMPGEFWSPRFTDYTTTIYKNSLTYTMSSMINMESETSHDEWDSPDEVEFGVDESLFITNNSLSTKFDNQFFDNIFGIVNSNAYSVNYRTHLNTLGADTSLLEYSDDLSDYQYHSINWNNDLNAYFYPLKSSKEFSQSKWTYNFDNLLYEKTFDSYIEGESPLYDENWASWDEEGIDRHNTGILIKYNPDFYYISTNAVFDLPPMDRKDSYTNQAGLTIFNWTSNLSQSITLEEDEWTYLPLVFTNIYKPFDKLRLEQDLTYDFEEDSLSKSRSYIKAWGYYMEYTREYTTPYTWDRQELDWIEEEKAFVPSRFSTGYTWDFDRDKLWKNRITTSSDLTLDWSVNLQQFNNNTLSFKWNYNFRIYQFMDLKFSMVSSNNNMYLYIPYYREKFDIEEEYSFLDDLKKSFYLFNEQERYESYFNLEKINLTLVHHLREWDLTLSYSGVPKLEDKRYNWKSEFSIFLKWNPIPQIQSDIQYKDEQWLVDTES